MPKVPMGIRISDVSQILDNEDIPIVSELVEILKLINFTLYMISRKIE